MIESKLALTIHAVTISMIYIYIYFSPVHRWDVKCCKTVDICPSECFLSYCINDLQGDINYCAKENGLFVGLYSDFDPAQL